MQKKLKVLMVGNNYTVKGGITTVITQYLNHNFSKDDIFLKFIPTYIDKNDIYKILFFSLALIKIIFCFIFWKPNIIHIHMSYKGSFDRAYIIHSLAKIFGIKVIIHLHGSEFKKWYETVSNNKKKQIRKLLKHADVFIVLGEIWNKDIKSIEPSTNTYILVNSVTVVNKNASFNSRKTILFLGVLIKRKGLHDLIDAINKINSNDFRLLIAGTGNEEDNLKLQVNNYGLKNIEFLGWTDNKEKTKLFMKSQFMVLPSYNEGLPMSILEAMSYGLPVLATNVGDIPSVINSKKNGFLYSPGNISDLIKLLNIIIEMDETTWFSLSEAAKNTISKKFSDVNYFIKITELYKSLVGKDKYDKR